MKKTKMTLQKRAALLLLLLLSALAGILFAYNFYVINSNMNRQIAQNSRNTLSLFTSWLNTGLDSLEDYLLYISASDQDFNLLGYQESRLDAHLYACSVLEKCGMTLMTEKTAAAFFVDSPKAGYFTKTFSAGASSSLRMQSGDFVKKMLESSNKVDTSRWTLHTIGGIPCLLRVMEQNQVYIAALVDLQAVSQLHPDLRQFDGSFVFRDSQGDILTHPADVALARREQNYGDCSIIKLGDAGRPFFIVEDEFPAAGLRIGYLAPYPGFLKSVDATLLFLFIFSCLVTGLVPVCFYLLRRFVLLPLGGLARVIGEIQAGNLEARTQSKTNIREFQEVYGAFDKMMDQIKSLKLAAYEQRLEAERAELQYLQIQIRPHFYLNCLKNLYGMAQTKQYDQMQKMILTLSDYLRNMLQASADTIPLSAELHNVENYILLQQMVASCPPSCQLQVDPSLLGFPVSPLSILTFVENSVKHGSLPGRSLHIQVKVKQIGGETGRFVNITILDDGKGFSKESLCKLDQPDCGGSHIGIANVKRRFALLYGDRHEFLFQGGNGSSVELFIPYKPDEAPGAEQFGKKEGPP